MRTVLLLLIGSGALTVFLFSPFFRSTRLDERFSYPFDIRGQGKAFIDRLLAGSPPEALAPPQERSEWEESRRFYLREVAHALGIDLFPEQESLERRGTVSNHTRYRVTSLSLETLPGIRVAAALYIPTHGSPPYPAILLSPEDEEIDSTSVRIIAATLASTGVAVMTLDMIDRNGGLTKRSHPETLFLTGFSPLAALVVEQRGAVSFLKKQPEIASSRIFLVGTGSFADAAVYTAALDDTIAGVAALSATTSFQSLAAHGEPTDIPVLPYRSFALHHLFALIAPRPFLLTPSPASSKYAAPHRETMRRTEEFYRFLGGSGAFVTKEPCEGKILSTPCRRRLYGLLTEHFFFPPVEEEEEEDIPSSDEVTDDPRHLESISLEELARREALIFRDMTRSRRDEIGPALYGQEIAEVIRDFAGAGLWGTPPPLDPRVHHTAHEENTSIESLSLASDPGVRIPLLLSTPSRAVNTVIVVSGSAFAREIAADLLTDGVIVLEMSLRRMEEGTLLDRLLRPVGGRRGAIAALVAGIPAAAQQATDILAALAYLRERFGDDTVVGLYAEGPEATLAALLAAHRDDRFGWIVLNGLPSSLIPSGTADAALARELALRIPGILRHGDITDLVATLAPRRTLVTGVIGPQNEVENEALFSSLLWEKRHVLILSRPNATVIVRFLRTRGTTPAP